MPSPLFRLRNAQKTRDRRLDRIPSFAPGERPREFSISALLEKLGIVSRPKPITKMWKVGVILNQGAEGACAAAAAAGELAAEPIMVPGITMEFAREQLYWPAQKIDGFEGGEYPGADPQAGGTSVLAVAKVVRSLGYITGYRWALSLEDVLYALSYMGPVILGTNWYPGMEKVGPGGFVRVTGRQTSGHCVLLIGHHTKEKSVTFVNSWSEDWGNNGLGKLRYADLARLLSENGEACIYEGRKGA